MELGNLTEMWYDIKNIRHNKFEFMEEVIMYIENKYWQNYIGDTDDSLNLIAFLEDQGSNEIAFSEILTDFSNNPLEYDLCELVPQEDILEMAEICENLRQELLN